MAFIDLEDLNVYYECTGPKGAPIVLLANSLGTNVHVWDAQVAALAADYRILRYDMRGHGLTQAGSGSALRIADLAADVARLLDALEVDAVTFVGLSIGGMIAQRFAAAYPARVDALVLCATASRIGSPQTWETRIAAVEQGGMSAIVPGVLERWFTQRAHVEQPALIKGFATMLERTPAPSYIAACGAIRDADLRADDRAVRCPTLVVAGAQDAVTTPAMAGEMCDAIPGARLHIVDAAAHILPAEAPDAFNPVLLRFLAESTRAAQTR